MKHCFQTGRRNYGRRLKRLLDTWDRNGSTTGPTPWQLYDDDDEEEEDDDSISAYDCEYCFELLIVFLGFLARPSVLSSDPRLILVVVGIETSIAFWDVLILISSTALIHHLQSLYNVFICCHQRRPREADIFHILPMAFVMRQHNQILTLSLSLVRVSDKGLMKTRDIDNNAES
jgi:hypothetical protein